MKRSLTQQMYLLAAALLGAAPVAFGLVRIATTGYDRRMLWMALVASVFTAGVAAAALGRRRRRRAVFRQAVVILCVSTLLSGVMGFLLGATAGPGVWAVALVFSICLAASSICVAFSRPHAG